MEFWISLILITFAGGVVQTIAGFGSGLVMMLVLPHLLSIPHAAAVTSISGAVLSAALIWKFKDKLRPRFVLLTLIPYLIASVIMLQFVQKIDTRIMAILFGSFLTLVGLYYMIWSDRAHLKITPLTVLGCTVISGLSSALFGIGGPLMSLMYLEKYETREEYSTNLQLLFLVAAIVNTTTRAINGIFTADLLLPSAAAIAAIMAGEKVGLALAGRMKPDFLRRMVYFMVFISGVITVVNNI